MYVFWWLEVLILPQITLMKSLMQHRCRQRRTGAYLLHFQMVNIEVFAVRFYCLQGVYLFAEGLEGVILRVLYSDHRQIRGFLWQSYRQLGIIIQLHYYCPMEK